MRFVQLRQHRVIGAFREFRFLIDQRHDVQLFDGNQIERILIVHEFDVLPIDALVIVFLLLQFENVLHEELLQILVREIDAKLFEAVVVEILKAENVQHSDGITRRRPWLVDCGIYLLDDQYEEAAVDTFDECIAHIHRLITRQRRHHGFAMCKQSFAGQRIDEGLHWNAEQCADAFNICVLWDFGCVQIVHDRRLVLDVAAMQKGRQQFENLPNLAVGKQQHFHGRPNVCELGGIVTSFAYNAITAGQVSEGE